MCLKTLFYTYNICGCCEICEFEKSRDVSRCDVRLGSKKKKAHMFFFEDLSCFFGGLAKRFVGLEESRWGRSTMP
jgi:hypothetical protein